MVDIKTSTIRSNTFETIYDALNSANLLSSTVTVTAAYADNDKAFPQVVINPVNIGESEYTFNRSHGTKSLIVVIDIFSKKNKYLDRIADEIHVVIRDLTAQGIMLINWNESNAMETSNSNKLHLKSITLEFRR